MQHLISPAESKQQSLLRRPTPHH